MKQCKFYNDLNGVCGHCEAEPPKFTKHSWEYPPVEIGCECRFYKEGKIELETESAPAPEVDDKSAPAPEVDDKSAPAPEAETESAPAPEAETESAPAPEAEVKKLTPAQKRKEALALANAKKAEQE